MASITQEYMIGLLDALKKWSSVQPDKILFTFLNDDSSIQSSVTYRAADLKTSALARYLVGEQGPLKLKKGDRVLLVFEPSLHYILSFIACVRAGLVAVPVFPPDPRKLKKDMYMFATICADCGAQVALTSTLYNSATKMAALKSLFSNDSKWPELRWVTVDDLIEVTAVDKLLSSNQSKGSISDDLFEVPTSPSDLAFLQYTSGSTSEPKGVMIAHSNLSHNLSSIIHELKADTSTVVVSWLPQYHDMGLIGSYLGVLYCGGSGYYLSPFAFLKNPLVWLIAVTKYKGTHMQAPNFGYALASRRFKLTKPPEPPLNLTSIRHMINAAEPVSAQDLQTFEETFKPFGLPSGVVFPTYGLAEHTVFVCSGGQQRISVDKKALEESGEVNISSEGDVSDMVGCGFPRRERPQGVAQVDVAIVASSEKEEEGGGGGKGKRLGEGKVGEIWIQSPSVAQGYYGNEVKTHEDFGAEIEGEEGTFLRTGDQGFLLNGELFVCGRLKDLIIVRGRNHYPTDIERCVEGAANNKLRAGRSAAFAVPTANGEEAVAVVAELRNKESKAVCEELINTLKAAVTTEQGVALHCIILCKDRTVPITTSGKIARRWCRRAYDSDSLSVIHKWVDPAADTSSNSAAGTNGAAAAAAEEMSYESVDQSMLDDNELLKMLVADVAAATHFDVADLTNATSEALVNLGMDSLGLAQVVEMLKFKYNCSVPDQWVYFESTTLEQILIAVRNGGVSEEEAESGVMLALNKSDGNSLVDTCPCLLMCCPSYVLNRDQP